MDGEYDVKNYKSARVRWDLGAEKKKRMSDCVVLNRMAVRGPAAEKQSSNSSCGWRTGSICSECKETSNC